MVDLVRQASQVQAFFEQRRWHFCFIGGLALLRWGTPRLTRDIDATVYVGFGNEEPTIDELLAQFRARLKDAKEFALTRRVVLLETPGGDGLDISLGGLPFERDLVERSSLGDYGDDIRLRTCSAEDLVVLKAFASRDQDWVDVGNVATRQRGRLDWPAIYERLAPLVELKEEPAILTRLKRVEGDHA